MATKLEQCLHLIQAMDEEARIELSPHPSDPRSFQAVAMDAHDGEIASGYGGSIELAATELHDNLAAYAERMRAALNMFGSYS